MTASEIFEQNVTVSKYLWQWLTVTSSFVDTVKKKTYLKKNCKQQQKKKVVSKEKLHTAKKILRIKVAYSNCAWGVTFFVCFIYDIFVLVHFMSQCCFVLCLRCDIVFSLFLFCYIIILIWCVIIACIVFEVWHCSLAISWWYYYTDLMCHYCYYCAWGVTLFSRCSFFFLNVLMYSMCVIILLCNVLEVCHQNFLFGFDVWHYCTVVHHLVISCWLSWLCV